jgi:DNA-binding NtrC family response regulator
MLRFELRLTSRLGLGSTFEFDLPATSRLPEHIVASAVETHAGPPMSVLVIDDEPEVRLSLRVMLEAADWTARTASGLDTALEELERGFRPDAIVVDYRLQGHLTGDEVANEIRASGCRVPAVIVTGDTDPDRLSALATCGYPVLHKPVHGDRLIATLVGAIESGRPAQEDCGTETA